MRKMKDSGIEWVGQIPEDKNIIRNKYLLKYIKGAIPSETNTNQVGIPYIGASDLENIYGDANYSTYTTDYSVPQCEKKDILILWDGARAGLIGKNHEGAISSTIVKIASCPTISSQFLYWYLKGFEKYLYDCVNGTTIPHMNKTYIENLQMITWSKEEQSRIADFLDDKCGKIDRYIEKQRQIIEKLKAYKQSVITEAVTKGLDPTVPMKDSGVEWIGMIPAYWNMRRLRYLGTCVNGISKGSEFFGSGYPFVSYGDVYKNMELPKTVAGLVESTDSERNWYSVREGDVFFTRTSETIEEVALTSTCMQTIENATFAGFLIRFRPSTNLLTKQFSKYYFRSDKHRLFFVKEMNLVTRASLSQELLKRLPVLLPPVEEQKQIATFLDRKCFEIDNMIDKKQAQIDKFIEYKKSLIYEAVTGKFEV